MKLMVYLGLVCRCIIGAVFMASAFTKLRGRRAFDEFRSWLMNIPLPIVRSRPALMAKVTVGAEVAIVILIGLPWTVRVGLAFSAAVLIVFATGMALMVVRGTKAPCHCFGKTAAPLGLRHVVRDVLLLAVAITGAVSAGSASTRPVGVILSLAVGVVIAMFAIFLEDIASLFPGTADTGESSVVVSGGKPHEQ